ncbi:unnamed protein product (plasmid) [Mycetohabitans rhizoxinica HKI 454]|uniref:Uncharacterized protein n=1 Tax=Mycetohabitans rhizoxinica (strain DSM 19002 / CIP 109453 / HKI 454) TaxID=882378 RepID=E5AVK7_MYCRK|nr:unnamed protein product [Mycetohabitans rhizoxinica HKI 454]
MRKDEIVRYALQSPSALRKPPLKTGYTLLRPHAHARAPHQAYCVTTPS